MEGAWDVSAALMLKETKRCDECIDFKIVVVTVELRMTEG